jgi:hypothetical protein
MNMRRASGSQYKYQVHAQSAAHLANFHHSRFRSSTAATPEACRRLDRFTLDTARSLHLEHAVDLDRFARSTPLTSTASPTPSTVRFAVTPDYVLRSTSSFPSPQVIHGELVNCCRILSSSTKIELPGHSGS